MNYKKIIRTFLNVTALDLSKNLQYDRLTKKIMKRVLKANSNCIDVGCHKGEILDIILQYSPKGNHFGFEPLPYLYEELRHKYKDKAHILSFALSDQKGRSSFNYVKNAPAYSGLKKRRYDNKNPIIEEIKIDVSTLDELIPPEIKIDFIKIDVEGGEFGVLKGARQIIKTHQPIIIFEFGLGASDYYGTKPIDIFNFLTKEMGLQISLLNSFLKNKNSLEFEVFKNYYYTNKEYYFIAHI